jgi:glycosyltransferase involved in cell wall biosynthesis
MKVSIISYGKFHAFDLARELKACKLNVKLYSSYPLYISKKYGIKSNEHFSFFLLQIIDRLTSNKISNLLKFIFAKFLTILIKSDQDFIIAWSDTPNFLIKFLKKNYKSIIIIERGSTHIEFQNKILRQEHASFNIDFEISKEVIQNENNNYHECDYISIPSQFVFNSFLEYNLPKSKLIVNPYGSDLSKFFPSSKNNEKFTILTVGHGSFRKGLIYVLGAHKLIKGDFIHYHVGSIENYIKKFSKTFPNFRHIESQSQEKLRDYYQKSDVFVLASLEEGLSLTLLEAMACGLPIITTRNSGVESIKSKLKFNKIIKPKSSNEIAEKINLFVNNPSLQKEYSKNSLKTVSEGGFSWLNYGKRYCENLMELKKQ